MLKDSYVHIMDVDDEGYMVQTIFLSGKNLQIKLIKKNHNLNIFTIFNILKYAIIQNTANQFRIR